MLFNGLDPSELLARVAGLVIALTVHEWAHAYSAYRLGDMTARDQGRLTLDPRRHLDPLGSLFLLVAGFGWAKPVPINPWRLGRSGVLQVSLAGPLSNLALAFGSALVLRLILAVSGAGLAPSGPLAAGIDTFFSSFIILNILLAVFNMLPIPPLDGSKVLSSLVRLSPEQQQRYERYGPMALLLLLVLGNGRGGIDILGILLMPPSRFLFGLIQRLVLGGGG